MSGSADAEALKKKLKKVTIGRSEFYVAEGDLLIPEESFEAYADERLGKKAFPVIAVPSGKGTAKLVAMGDNNKPLRWAPGVVLTYYVRKETFPGNLYAKVRENMTHAAEDWMNACGVEFRHLVGLDADEAARCSQSALFDVKQVDVGGAFYAAAFFPDAPVERRSLIIDPSYFIPELLFDFDTVGMLRHELGHILGFRHENIRSGAPPECPKEDLSHTIDLTAYDPQSVMHYFCGGVGSKSLDLTAADREGARTLYGPPLSNFELVRP